MFNVGFNSSPVFAGKMDINETSEKPVSLEAEYDYMGNREDAVENDMYIPSKSEAPKMKEYIPADATPQEVRDILADKKQAGRSFWGFKRSIKNMVKDSDDKETTIYNLNYLMNADKGNLGASEINKILFITEQVNKGSDNLFRYGFKGGKLDDESFKNITAQRVRDLSMGIALSSILNGQMSHSQMMLEQQMMFDQQNQLFQQQVQQDMFTHQQMMNNHMMGF